MKDLLIDKQTNPDIEFLEKERDFTQKKQKRECPKCHIVQSIKEGKELCIRCRGDWKEHRTKYYDNSTYTRFDDYLHKFTNE